MLTCNASEKTFNKACTHQTVRNFLHKHQQAVCTKNYGQFFFSQRKATLLHNHLDSLAAANQFHQVSTLLFKVEVTFSRSTSLNVSVSQHTSVQKVNTHRYDALSSV